MIKSTILFIAGLLFFIHANAQTSFTVSGSVRSENTSDPLVAASVFAENTTLGTVTDADGNFKLSLPAGGYDLIITYTGYRTVSRRITGADATANMIITLKEKEKELETVSIVASNEVMDGLEKYGSFFNEEFIGKTANSAFTSIQNPEVLHFFFSKRKNRLKITATEPLIINNNALGYKIKYALDSFTHEYGPQISTYSGYPLFEEMQGDSAQKQIWETARRTAYTGSLLHFMRSIFNKDLKASEFEIQYIVKTNGNERALKVQDPYAAINYFKDDSTQTVEIMSNQKDMGILYSGKKPSSTYLKTNPDEPADLRFSMLSFANDESVIIEQNGYFYDQNNISISGYWTWEKVADQLPYDYRYLQQ